MASPAILSNFFEEQWTQNHPQYLSGLSRALFCDTDGSEEKTRVLPTEMVLEVKKYFYRRISKVEVPLRGNGSDLES